MSPAGRHARDCARPALCALQYRQAWVWSAHTNRLRPPTRLAPHFSPTRTPPDHPSRPGLSAAPERHAHTNWRRPPSRLVSHEPASATNSVCTRPLPTRTRPDAASGPAPDWGRIRPGPSRQASIPLHTRVFRVLAISATRAFGALAAKDLEALHRHR
jgi:hypothetical protein